MGANVYRLLLAIGFGLSAVADARAETLAEARIAVDAKYQAALQVFPDGKDKLRPPARGRRQVLFPASLIPADPSGAADRTFALGFFELVQRFAKEEPTATYQLLHEILYMDPAHQQARKILGHREVRGKWIAGPESPPRALPWHH